MPPTLINDRRFPKRVRIFIAGRGPGVDLIVKNPAIAQNAPVCEFAIPKALSKKSAIDKSGIRKKKKQGDSNNEIKLWCESSKGKTHLIGLRQHHHRHPPGPGAVITKRLVAAIDVSHIPVATTLALLFFTLLLTPL